MGTNSVDEKTVKGVIDADDTQRRGSVAEGELEAVLGYKPELQRNRSLFTLLFQSLAIAAIPYGEGSPLISAIYGGGQLYAYRSFGVVWDTC